MNATGGVRVLRMRGEIDIESARDWRPEITEAVGDTSTPLVIDLSDVTFLDSTGLGLLMQTHSRLQRQGRRLGLVVRPAGIVDRLLESTNLTTHLFTFPDRESAEADARSVR